MERIFIVPPNLSQMRPVFLCGGMGTRLAPLSTPEKPKPFLSLLSEYSMLQETALRVKGAKSPAVLCNTLHAALVERDLAKINMVPDVIIHEPSCRNTGPAAALAGHYYAERNPDEILLFLPCDHQIQNLTVFHQALITALNHLQKEPEATCVLFGETPYEPDTGYGYIKIEEEEGRSVHSVCLFHEKPDKANAIIYIREGCLWNTGIVMVRAKDLANAFAHFSPEIWKRVKRLSLPSPEATYYKHMPNISIDHALLEKWPYLMLCPVNMGWTDIGTLERLAAKV